MDEIKLKKRLAEIRVELKNNSLSAPQISSLKFEAKNIARQLEGIGRRKP